MPCWRAPCIQRAMVLTEIPNSSLMLRPLDRVSSENASSSARNSWISLSDSMVLLRGVGEAGGRSPPTILVVPASECIHCGTLYYLRLIHRLLVRLLHGLHRSAQPALYQLHHPERPP